MHPQITIRGSNVTQSQVHNAYIVGTIGTILAEAIKINPYLLSSYAWLEESVSQIVSIKNNSKVPYKTFGGSEDIFGLGYA